MKIKIISIIGALVTSLASMADQEIIIKVPEPEPEPSGPPPAPEAKEQEPVLLPQDIHNQLKINVINESGKDLIFYAKIKAASGQKGIIAQPWEYLKVYTLVKESNTIASFFGNYGSQYEYERSRLLTHEKDERGQSLFQPLECKLASSTDGKLASKSITFIVTPQEEVLVCLVYYDRKI